MTGAEDPRRCAGRARKSTANRCRSQKHFPCQTERRHAGTGASSRPDRRCGTAARGSHAVIRLSPAWLRLTRNTGGRHCGARAPATKPAARPLI